jgi:hypothetical protein
MILRSSTFLGIAVGDKTVGCAEVSTAGGRRAVKTVATLTFPQGVSLDTPEAAGAALRAFLNENGFGASRAVVGVPARWLIARENDVPPADREQVRAMLALAAERLSAAESSELVFDFAGRIDSAPAGDPTAPRRVLLVAMLRQRLEQLDKMMDAAGVSVLALTSSALVLAEAARRAGQDLPMLLLGRQGAEMVFHHAGTPRMLRHLSVVAQNGHGVATGPLGSEVRRVVALAPTFTNGDTGSGNGSGREMLLWDAVGLSDEQASQLSERIGVRFRPDDGLQALGIETPPTATQEDDRAIAPGQFAPAVSLALAAADRALVPVDFKHSRLAAPRKRTVGSKTLWGAILAAVVVIGIAALYYHVQRREDELMAKQAQLTADKPRWDEAKKDTDHLGFGLSFFEKRSAMLESLREITLAFPQDEPIWITHFTIREDRDPRKGTDIRRGTLQGKAPSQDTVRKVSDRLKENSKFSEVSFQYVQPAAGAQSGSGRSQTPEHAFFINFIFTEPKAPAESHK